MTLGEYIAAYRQEHGLSQRQFGKQCNLTNGYISMLEKNMNPRTGKPISVQMKTLKQIADGLGMTVHDLFLEVDDMPIDLIVEHEKKSGPEEGTELSRKLTDAISQMTEEQQEELWQHAFEILSHDKPL